MYMKNKKNVIIGIIGIAVLASLYLSFFTSNSDVLQFKIENLSDGIVQDVEVTFVTPKNTYAHNTEIGSIGPGSDFTFVTELSNPTDVRVSALLDGEVVRFESDVYRDGLPRFFKGSFVTASGEEADIAFSVAPPQQ